MPKEILRNTRFLTLLILTSAVLMLHFSYHKASEEVTATAHAAAEEFLEAAASLQKAGDDFKYGRGNLAELRKEIAAARNAYKKVEFLLDYYYPGYVEEHINGAPLLHIERYDTRPFVLPPEGLQVLDELIYSDESESEKVQIATLTRQLYNHSLVLVNGFKKRHIEDAEVIEAMRSELVRIFAMGITGFDTPGSVNALEEAGISLASLKEASAPFLKNTDVEMAFKINSRFEAALAFLDTGAGFDDFDRLAFLKEYINPLYADLLLVKKDLQLPLGSKAVSARNIENTNIFSQDFLDPYFYTELSRKEDSKELRALGKKLFHDPMLSANGQMSCGTCHNPALAFTDGKAKSASNLVGETVQRNAPTLLNAVYSDRYFYDLRAFTLEQQTEHVIFNENEFNTAYEEITAKLNADEEYRHLFKKALGEKKVTRDGLSKALASYVLSLQSFNSEFDQFVRGELAEIDPKVKEGFNLFMGKAACATCHFAPTFTGLVPPFYTKNESEILGVLESPIGFTHKLDPDLGRYANQIYSEEAWIYERSFKTSTVRNVEVTAPYFHNGAYQTLESVVDFYDHGGGAGLGLEVTNQTLPADSLRLSPSEKEALVAFMKSLTDTSGAGGSSEAALSSLSE